MNPDESQPTPADVPAFREGEPDNLVSFWRGPVGPGLYPEGILAARVFLDYVKDGNILVGIETDDGKCWRRPYVEVISFPGADDTQNDYDMSAEDIAEKKAEERLKSLYHYIWGTLRVGIVLASTDGETFNELSRFESPSLDGGLNFPVPVLLSPPPGFVKVKARLLGVRDGYPFVR